VGFVFYACPACPLVDNRFPFVRRKGVFRENLEAICTISRKKLSTSGITAPPTARLIDRAGVPLVDSGKADAGAMSG
jgi:hypothetical protein